MIQAPRRSSATRAYRQGELPFRKTWGGRREGAGRRPRPEKLQSVPHSARPLHKAAHPVHLTLRARRVVGASLRTQSLFPVVREAIRATNRVDQGRAFRIVHFSVQTNHIHLIVEAADKNALRRGAAGLAVRAARAINRALGRRGGVWAERYHTLFMMTPRHVRNTIIYVLFNIKKHQTGFAGFDGCSSAQWFDGFQQRPVRDGPAAEERLCHGPPSGGGARAGDAVVARPGTWLLSVGWRRHGLLSTDERPADQRPAR